MKNLIPIDEAAMLLKIEQKLTVRKVLLAIIGGLITITIFRYALSLAIESRYGIDTDTHYPDKRLILSRISWNRDFDTRRTV